MRMSSAVVRFALVIRRRNSTLCYANEVIKWCRATEMDFSQKTKAALASRAGFRCSLPNCRAQTIGPDHTPDGSLKI